MITSYRTIELFGKTLFSWVEIQPPLRAAAPMPDNEACFSYLLTGQSYSWSPSEEIKMLPQQAFLSKCGNYVAEMQAGENQEPYSSITVHFIKGVLEKIYEGTKPPFLKKPSAQWSAHSAKVSASIMVKQYFGGIIHLFNHRELVSEDILILKLKEIILLLLKTENSPKVLEIMHHLFATKTYDFKEVIEAHICSPLTLKELAGLTNMSLSSFRREFKRIYQDTPTNYIIHRRTEMVAERLLVSDEQISHIAYDCGFNSVSHLSKVFKEKYGISPSQYRLNLSDK